MALSDDQKVYVGNESARDDFYRSFNNRLQSFNNESNLEGLVFNFIASQEDRLSMFEADFKHQQSEMTHKMNTVLKAITDRIADTLPSDMAKNPKLSTSLVLSARSYPTEDPQCSTHFHGSINTITIHPKQQNYSQDSMEEREATSKTPTPLLTLKNKEIRHCWSGKT
nr:hypothetical protein [Tanacetum cinerariifolium]